MRRSTCKTLVIASLVAGLVGPLPAETFCVGTGTGSTHSTLGLALLAATVNGPASDLIKVPKNVSYTGIGLLIGNQSLQIAGGYPDCEDPTPNGRTTIRGPGISQKTVFEVDNGTGFHFVSFSNLFITEGTDDDDDGGGLQIGGGTIVSLYDTKIALNSSDNGGGILIDGTGGAILTIDAASEIIDNHAVVDGGGIFCHGGGTIFAAGTIGLNDAGGNGIGVYLDDCSFSNVGTLDLFQHTGGASLGGGIYAGNGSSVDLLGDDNPVRIRDSYALRGGGLYLTGPGTTATLGNTHVVDNMAKEGGAGIYVADGAHLDTDCFRGSTVPDPCSSISDNHAINWPVALHGGGGGLLVHGGGTATIFHTTLSGNQAIDIAGLAPPSSPGGAALVIGMGSEVVFESSLISSSVGTNAIQTSEGGSVELRFSTAAGHTALPPGETLGGVAAFADMENASDNLELRSSIVWNPGVPVLGSWLEGSQRFFDCLILNETLSTPDGSSVIEDVDPLFLAAAQGDYHLATSSPAIDVCDTSSTTPQTVDIDGDLRLPGSLGLYDLGMDESTLVFTDGFESGNTSAWV